MHLCLLTLCCSREAVRDSSKVWPFDDTESGTAEPDDEQGVPESKSTGSTGGDMGAPENADASGSARESPGTRAPATAPATADDLLC